MLTREQFDQIDSALCTALRDGKMNATACSNVQAARFTLQSAFADYERKRNSQPFAEVFAHLNAGGVVKLLTHEEAVADADSFRAGAQVPVAKITSTDERATFEAAYIADLNAATGNDYPATEMVGLREGDAYGDRAYLNGCWWGWQAHAAR